tara:strand:- start:178 stop:2400 length:2223 start_codon:yes stop_codon:yes gene_type:complete
MNQQQYPMEGIAEHLANQGRYGDSMLMHVNPAEVEGIASLIPGGQLPRNPMTGQPEAFIGMILSMIAKPLLTKGVAALGAKAGAGALGSALTGLAGSSAAMTGITSGLIETARTGDIKKGFTSGLMGAGIGKALGAATDAVDKGIGTAADQVGDLTKSVAGAEQTITDLSSVGKLTDAQRLGLADAERLKGNILGGEGFIGPPTADGLNQGSMRIAEDALSDARIAAGSGTEGYKSLGDVFQGKGFKAGVSEITKPEAFLPLALGASQRAELDYQDAMDAEGRRMEEEKAAEEQYSRDLMERSFGQIREDYPEMDNKYNPYAYGQGGIISIDPTQYAQTLQGLSDVAGPIDMNAGGVVNMREGGPASMIYNTSPSGAGKGGVGGAGSPTGSSLARNRQAKIRGTDLVAPEEGYRPGFDAEHRFFQNIEKVEDSTADSNASKDAVVSDQVSQFADDPYINAIVGEALGGLNPRFLGMEGLDPSEFMDLQKSADGLGRKGIMARKKLRNLQEKQSEEIEKANEFESEMAGITAITESSAPKGKVAGMPESAMDSPYLSDFNPRTIADFSNFRPKFRGSMGMQEGGVAELPDQEQMMNQPSADDAQFGQLIEQTALALLGQVSQEEAEIIINRFIDEFGQEAFQMLREQVLQGVVPNAQTQGLIEGEGGGMDDEVQGMIGDQQRVAVSPGEFIVPADVVSGLGDGDTGAGADELDDMMDRVRVERTGTQQQPPRLSAGGLLPA